MKALGTDFTWIRRKGDITSATFGSDPTVAQITMQLCPMEPR
jgi:hypothetical protein